MKTTLVAIIFLFIISLAFVSSAPTKFTTSTVGYDIEHPFINPYKYGEDIKFHFHIFNSSTGLPILANKLIANCTFHLYNSTGSHILKVNNQVSSDDIYDWEQLVKAGNFTYSGQYAYVFQCNSSTEGGYLENDFYVTATGVDLTTPKALLYGLIWVISFLIFLGLLIYGLANDGNNKRDEMTGYILEVSNKKYLKIFSLAFSYVVLIFLSYFTWMIALAYLDMNFMATIFQFIFYILAIATLPLFIIFCYLLIANKVRDSKIQDALSRGLRIK